MWTVWANSKITIAITALFFVSGGLACDFDNGRSTEENT